MHTPCCSRMCLEKSGCTPYDCAATNAAIMRALLRFQRSASVKGSLMGGKVEARAVRTLATAAETHESAAASMTG